MFGLVFLLVLLFALVIPLVLWLAIDNETSNPTVVDRSDAEQLAKERGGRGGSRSSSGADAARTDPDEQGTESGWGTRPDDADRYDR
ncbi:hypothetical protein [Natronorubrum sp. FCH18a]|uniref:hypothetical protein n=1 Tax=Natronorubrum sp. FCH18a TaxID=3447018 RepID=UPI003F518181